MMRLTIERMRAGVVAGTVVLLATLGGVLLYAHYRARGLLRDLPSRLGVDIQKQTNGVTYSQTIKGRTVFTVHAAQATQHRNGEAELEDAGIVLYGDGTGRADRIYGKRFHYDQGAGVIRALGQVQLDLEAQAPVTAEDRSRFASGAAVHGTRGSGAAGNEQQPVHVTTSDLVYSQRTGLASTPEPLHFEYGGVVGDARGASYNAQTGFTVFDHDIKLSGSRDGRQFHLTAEHGELDRVANRLTLRAALLESRVAGQASERIAAAVLILHPGAGGGLERVEGTDGVEISASGSSARAPAAELTLRAGNHPEQVKMRGGVQFSQKADEGGAEMTSGSAEECLGQFDQRDALASLLLSRHVVVETSSTQNSGVRRLTGGKVLLALASTPGTKRTWIRQVTAEDAAELKTSTPEGTDELRADWLQTQLELDGIGHGQLRMALGRGHVTLHRHTAGVEEMSRAETIDASFSTARAPGPLARTRTELLSGVERGSVILDRSTKTAAGVMQTVRGSAREATYDGGARSTTLVGDAVLAQAGDTVRASRIVVANETGDAEANGAVQATLTPAGRTTGIADAKASPGEASPEPVHAVAARARFEHEADVVTLFGEAGRPARIWRGASQIEAPILTLRDRERTLDASGERDDGTAVVKTVLADEPARTAASSGASQTSTAKVVRVESQRLHYSQLDQQAKFTGGVVLRSADGILHAKRAVATMAVATGWAAKEPTAKRRAPEGESASAALLGSALRRVVADGGIRVEQPGRVATGQLAVYTASDGFFVLTGTRSAPPVVTDELNGALTGAVIRFHTGDNRVAVEGGTVPSEGGRVHTELRLKQ